MNELTRQCRATGRNGLPCRRYVAPGFTRCNLHGGHTPLARQAAAEALARAALPGAEALFDIIDRYHRETCPTCGYPNGDPAPVIKAAFGVLDRTGFGPSATVQLTPTPEAELLGKFSGMSLAELADRAEAMARRLRAAADAEADAEAESERRELVAVTDTTDAVLVEGDDDADPNGQGPSAQGH